MDIGMDKDIRADRSLTSGRATVALLTIKMLTSPSLRHQVAISILQASQDPP